MAALLGSSFGAAGALREWGFYGRGVNAVKVEGNCGMIRRWTARLLCNF